jgi:DNA-binding beta-propeller fold protein YncE
MKPSFRLRATIGSVGVLAAISLTGDLGKSLAGSYVDGEARLVSIAPLAAMDPAMCEWEPAGASAPAAPSFLNQQASGAAGAPSRTPQDLSQRKPERMIRDPYPSFSAITVDHKNDEVILSDQNLFQILIYDRMTNTPPTASFTEPKRVLGGDKTEIEFQVGLYVDPVTGDIYGTNNDTVNKMVVFSRDQRGNVAPKRELHTPNGRSFGIAVDEAKEEMFIVIQRDNAVVVFPKYANDDDVPLRLLQGDRTMLADPHDIVLDVKNNLMYVTNYGPTSTTRAASGLKRKSDTWPLSGESVIPGSGRYDEPSITVHRMDATGNTPPVRMIQGPKARLNWATGLSLDPERGELYVANDQGDEILVFDSTANGDVAPKRILSGPKSLIKNPMGVYVDLKNDELWVANFGNHTATVYRRDASGNTAPLRLIRSAPTGSRALMLGNPHPVAYDSSRDEILVPN